jgi:hypothetical protein
VSHAINMGGILRYNVASAFWSAELQAKVGRFGKKTEFYSHLIEGNSFSPPEIGAFIIDSENYQPQDGAYNFF